MDSSKYCDADAFFRGMVANRCGGAGFDVGGSYVFSEMLKAERMLAETSVPGDPTSAVLAFSVADPVWKMDEMAFQAGCKHYEVSPDATRYTDLAGIRNITVFGQKCATTQEALALLVNRGNKLTADNVQYSPGAIKRALAEYLPTAFFDEETILLMPSPSYEVITSPMNCRDASVVKVPLIEKDGTYHLDYKKLHDNVEVIKTQQRRGFHRKIVMYVNIPHNPTGFGYTKFQWKKLLEFAKKFGILLIVDEAYVDIAYQHDIVSVTEVDDWQNNSIVIQSISKAYNATGARFGWFLAHPTAIKVLRKAMDCKDSGMPASIIASGLYCLENKELAAETRKRYEDIHHEFSKVLGECGFETVLPDAGLCQLSGFPSKAADGTKFKTPTEFANWLRQNYLVSVKPENDIGKLRWAATFRPQPEYGLHTEKDVLNELKRRLKLAIG